MAFRKLIVSWANGIMPHRSNKRFDVAGFMKARKAARALAVERNRTLQAEYKRIGRTGEKIAKAQERRLENILMITLIWLALLVRKLQTSGILGITRKE